MLILTIVFSQLFSTFNLYLNRAYGLSESRIGPLWAVNTIMIVAIEMALVHALRRTREMSIVVVGAVLIGIGFGLLPFGRGSFRRFHRRSLDDGRSCLTATVPRLVGTPRGDTWASELVWSLCADRPARGNLPMRRRADEAG
jgi:hypothetical protein